MFSPKVGVSGIYYTSHEVVDMNRRCPKSLQEKQTNEGQINKTLIIFNWDLRSFKYKP